MTLTKEILDFAGKDAASLEETERVTLLQACEKLALALETPLEKFIRLFFVSVLCCFTNYISTASFPISV